MKKNICYIVFLTLLIILMIILIVKKRESFTVTVDCNKLNCDFPSKESKQHYKWIKDFIEYESQYDISKKTFINILNNDIDVEFNKNSIFINYLEKYNYYDNIAPEESSQWFKDNKRYFDVQLNNQNVVEINKKFLDLFTTFEVTDNYNEFSDDKNNFLHFLKQFIYSNLIFHYGNDDQSPEVRELGVYDEVIEYDNELVELSDITNFDDDYLQFTSNKLKVKKLDTYEYPLKINKLAEIYIQLINELRDLVYKKYKYNDINYEPLSMKKLKKILLEILNFVIETKGHDDLSKKITNKDLPCSMYSIYDCPTYTNVDGVKRCIIDDTEKCAPNNNNYTIDVDDCNFLSDYGKKTCENTKNGDNNCKYNEILVSCNNPDHNLEDDLNNLVCNKITKKKYNDIEKEHKKFDYHNTIGFSGDLQIEKDNLEEMRQTNGEQFNDDKTKRLENLQKYFERKNLINSYYTKITQTCNTDVNELEDNDLLEYKNPTNIKCINYINTINNLDNDTLNKIKDHCNIEKCNIYSDSRDNCNSIEFCHYDSSIRPLSKRCHVKNKCVDKINQGECKEDDGCVFDKDGKCKYNDINDKLIKFQNYNADGNLIENNITCDTFDNSKVKLTIDEYDIVTQENKLSSEQIDLDNDRLKLLCQKNDCNYYEYGQLNSNKYLSKCLDKRISVNFKEHTTDENKCEGSRYENCENKNNCYWHKTNYDNCGVINDEDRCGNLDNCEWKADKCIEKKIGKTCDDKKCHTEVGYCKTYNTGKIKELDNIITELHDRELNNLANHYINQEKMNSLYKDLLTFNYELT